MNKRHLLDKYLNELLCRNETPEDVKNLLLLYTVGKWSEKEISEKMKLPLYRVRQQLGKAVFLAEKLASVKAGDNLRS